MTTSGPEPCSHLEHAAYPLEGRVVLVTGVSRPADDPDAATERPGTRLTWRVPVR